MSKEERDIGEIIFYSLMGISLLVVIIGGLVSFYDSFWVEPLTSEKANEYCKKQGFDFYESYERIGLVSKSPIAIRCKYVEQYRQIDINSNKDIIIGGNEK